VQVRQIEAPIAHPCHGFGEHFQRYTVAILPANTRARVARQCVVQFPSFWSVE
jgi:hypothetical protein